LRLVNHWATWCDGCVEELPLLVALHGRIGEQVEFIGVSWDGFQGGLDSVSLIAEVARFSQQQGLPWESLVVGLGPDALFDALEMRCHTVPQVWLIDAQGKIILRFEDVLTAADVAEIDERVKAMVG
jgi:thiol-disulfide isomerase/thioredoxin